MPEQRIELFEEYRESGFDGKYERTTRYRLIVDEMNRNAVVVLEKEVEKRTVPYDADPPLTSRWQLELGTLVALIEQHGTNLT